MVMANSSTPQAISADRPGGTPGSPKFSAITDARVLPEANRLGVIWVAAPTVSATAMVSPMARPRPSMTAPTMPPKLCGKTAPRIISHRVAPSAHAACFSDSGTVANTSRMIDVTIGMIMMATMMPAVMNPRPVETGCPNSVPSTGTSPRPLWTAWYTLTSAGPITMMPNSPKTTEGTEASTTMIVTTVLRSRRGASSVRYSAMPMAIGTANTSAIRDTTVVPYTNDSAPYTGPAPLTSTGTHDLLNMKRSPEYTSAGQASLS